MFEAEGGAVSADEVMNLKALCSQECINGLASRLRSMGSKQCSDCCPETAAGSVSTGSGANPGSGRRAVIGLVLIFGIAVLCLGLVYYNFPKLDPSEKVHVKVPKNIEDAKNLGLILSRYKDRYYFTVLSAVLVSYLFLQSFAIPGSLFLSILSGFLFPFPLALFLVCLCSAVGASLCYLLSYLVGRRLVLKYVPEKAAQYSAQVARHKSDLLNYIIFLRITPFLPNWLINIAAPVIDVPLGPFFLGTFLGVAPPSFIAIQAGQTLNKMTSDHSLTWSSILLLVVFASLSVLPILCKGKLREKFM